MKEEQAMRLWADIGGIDDMYLEELEQEASIIAAKASKVRRRVKYGAIVTAAASLSAAVAFMVFRTKVKGKPWALPHMH